MTALTPAEIEFAAKLVTGVGGPLQSVSSAFFTADSSKWLAFGSVVEAMRERGWEYSADSDHEFDIHELAFSREEAKSGMGPHGEASHTNPAVAAIRAAHDALGGEAC